MVSKIITSANGKNKVIDFRDGLNLALPEHYATIHQTGGKKTPKGRRRILLLFVLSCVTSQKGLVMPASPFR